MKDLVMIFLAVLIPFMMHAQVMDDSDISKLQEGKYKIEKGKVQVTFVDTVSPEFIESEFDKMGLKILSSNFQPIMLKVVNKPNAITMKDLEDNKWVEFIMSESAGADTEDLKKATEKDSVDDKRINEMLAQLNHSGEYEYIMIGLTYSATENAISEILSIHPDLEVEISEKSERTIVIQTHEDKELEVMDRLKALAYVENTAMVGSLE